MSPFFNSSLLWQVEGADEKTRHLPDAPDGSTIVVRPLDYILVRCIRDDDTKSAGESLTSRDTACARAALIEGRFVPLSVRSTWSEVEDTVKDEFDVPTGCRVEVRRLVPGSGETVTVDADSSGKDEGHPISVYRLRNGDSLVVTVLDKVSDRVGGASVTEGVCSNRTSTGLSSNSYERNAVVHHGVLQPSSSSSSLVAVAPVIPLPLAGKDNNPELTQEAVQETVDNILVVPCQLPLTPPRPSRPPLSGVAKIPAACSGQRTDSPTKGNDSSAGPAVDYRPEMPLAQLTTANSLSRGAASSVATPPLGTLSRLPDGPTSPTTGIRAFPVPSPSLSPAYNRNTASSFTPAARTPSPLKGVGPSMPSVSSADEAAVAELVGMGFDREHVLGALRVCGRGDSWKEAAISLLLEPQASPEFELSITDPEAGLKGRKGVTSGV